MQWGAWDSPGMQDSLVCVFPSCVFLSCVVFPLCVGCLRVFSLCVFLLVCFSLKSFHFYTPHLHRHGIPCSVAPAAAQWTGCPTPPHCPSHPPHPPPHPTHTASHGPPGGQPFQLGPLSGEILEHTTTRANVVFRICRQSTHRGCGGETCGGWGSSGGRWG